jgi:hypothetical protein
MEPQEYTNKHLRSNLVLVLVLVFLAGTSCTAKSTSGSGISQSPITDSSTASPEITTSVPSLTPDAPDTPASEWLEYSDQTLPFHFLYPSSWYGPDVYAWEDGLRLEIGSDLVYPYGTSREDQVSTVPDSYYVTIQYNLNRQNLSWEDLVNSGWFTTYLELSDLEAGGSITTARSLAIKVREVTLGNFQGQEYIVTLPENAQTERVYIREIVAFDDNLNWIRITGSPNLVTVQDQTSWKTDYQRVDESYLDIFRAVADSISAE